MLSREEQDLEVRIAIAAAAQGDPWEMISHLQRANILAGVKLTFSSKWPSIQPDDVDDMISAGVEALFDKLSRGHVVANPVGYILEVMRHEAWDFVQQHRRTMPLDAAGELRGAYAAVDVDSMSSERRTAALSAARALLPRLGQDSVQSVMGRIFDAIEDGQAQIHTQELAQLTGLTDESVRQCRSRGFRRLERLIREEGLTPEVMIPESSVSRTGRAI